MKLRKILIQGASILVFFASFASLAMADQFEVVARTGMASSYGPTTLFSRLIASSGGELARPIIAHSGDVCFHSMLTGSGVTGGSGLTVFCSNSQSSNPVWRRETQATGLPVGVLFGGLSGLKINEFGQVTFLATLAGSGVQPAVNDRGIWLADAHQSTVMARDGSPMDVSGYPNATMRTLTGSYIAAPDSLGPVVVHGDLNGTGLGNGVQAVLQQTSNGFLPAMLANTQLPDAAPGTDILAMTPVVGPRGINAYQTTLAGPAVGIVMINGIPINTDKAITAGMGSQIRTVARSGFQVPTEAPGVAFSLVWSGTNRLSTNRGGDIAFYASMVGPGMAVGTNWGLWLDRAGQLSRIARLTDAAPVAGATIGDFGLASGVTFVNLTDDGAVVFTAMISGGGASSVNNSTLIYAHNGVQTLVARAGVVVPALPAGVTLLNTNLGLGAKLSSSGHVALAVKLGGTGVTSANNAAVFLWTPNDSQGLQLKVREGDVLGNYRVTNISEFGTDLQINTQGRMLFTATVVDVNDALQTSRKALITAAPNQPVRIVAVEGGTLSLPSGTNQVRTLRIGTTEALNDSGKASFVVDFGNGIVIDEAALTVQLQNGAQCAADFNQNGSVDVADIFAFLSAWFAQSPTADTNGNGQVQVDDIFAFLSAWFEGC